MTAAMHGGSSLHTHCRPDSDIAGQADQHLPHANTAPQARHKWKRLQQRALEGLIEAQRTPVVAVPQVSPVAQRVPLELVMAPVGQVVQAELRGKQPFHFNLLKLASIW